MAQARATLRYARLSPLKAREVLREIQGKTVEDALKILKFSPRKASRLIYKVLLSAVDNASQKGCDVDLLYVSKAVADRGPVMKRIQPRAMGRAYLIIKPTCHITVEVKER
jgi:large subunit ribosomal protein L22